MDCIIFTGPPGVGKTTLLNIFSSKYGYKTFDIIDFYSPDSNFSKQETISVFYNMLIKVEEIMMSKKNIIVEGFFYDRYRQESIKNICINNNYRLVLINLTASPLELVKRVKLRDEKRINNKITEEQVLRSFENFKNMNAHITINTTGYSIEEIEKKIIEILNS